jgi:hypothetical protein
MEERMIGKMLGHISRRRKSRGSARTASAFVNFLNEWLALFTPGLGVVQWRMSDPTQRGNNNAQGMVYYGRPYELTVSATNGSVIVFRATLLSDGSLDEVGSILGPYRLVLEDQDGRRIYSAPARLGTSQEFGGSDGSRPAFQFALGGLERMGEGVTLRLEQVS